MIIAEQKYRENIAEYLIYMYQVEDLIRANSFDPQRIEQTIISQFDTTYDVKREMLEWYKGLIRSLTEENKQRSGHLSDLQNITSAMNTLNLKMLEDPMDNEVKSSFKNTKAVIEALRNRSGDSRENDVQLAMNGLYGYLILKIQKKEISQDTRQAFSQISDWIAALSAEYMKTREL